MHIPFGLVTSLLEIYDPETDMQKKKIWKTILIVSLFVKIRNWKLSGIYQQEFY